MRRISAFFILLALLSCSPRIVTVAVHDTLTVTRTEVLRDTVISVRLPEETAARETRDTLSHLETSYAQSDASVSSGVLRHTLENKPTPLKEKIVYKDRTVTEYKVKEVHVPVEVPVRYIPKWVWWVLGWAVLLTILIIAAIWFRFRV